MKDGFIKVSAGSPMVKVADCAYNAGKIISMVREMENHGAKIMVFPELCITAYTCGDLFWQENLLEEAKTQLFRIAEETKDVDGLIFVGLPLEYNGKLYNVAAGLSRGEILGFVPKIHIPNYNEFYEGRYFTSGKDVEGTVYLTQAENGEYEAPIGTRMIFTCPEFPKLQVAAEICEDLWVLSPPSVSHAYHGANVIVNLSASDEVVGKDSYRKSLVSGQSARLLCGYIYATAGEGESTQDVVYGGQNMIAENGTVLAESRRFVNGAVYGELDIQRLDRKSVV